MSKLTVTTTRASSRSFACCKQVWRRYGGGAAASVFSRETASSTSGLGRLETTLPHGSADTMSLCFSASKGVAATAIDILGDRRSLEVRRPGLLAIGRSGKRAKRSSPFARCSRIRPAFTDRPARRRPHRHSRLGQGDFPPRNDRARFSSGNGKRLPRDDLRLARWRARAPDIRHELHRLRAENESSSRSTSTAC